MGVASLFLIFMCLAVVVYWYAVNEEQSADGEVGLFALAGGAGSAGGVFAAKYVMKSGPADAPTSRIAEARRLAEGASGRGAYVVRSRGRRASLRDLYAGNAMDAVTLRDKDLSPAAGYRRVEGPRYRQADGAAPRSRYVRQAEPVRS